MISNMFDRKKVDLQKDPNFYIDIKDQVKACCSDFGRVVLVFVEQASDEGRVWVKFDSNDVRGATRTQESLDSQFFD